MKVLVIGSGGREHALVYGLAKSAKVDKLYAWPGNPGIKELAETVDGKVDDLEAILRFVEEKDIDFTVIGPEVPLCLGLADLLEEHGHKVFGPLKKAAHLEGSKAFAKDFMQRHHIPTAAYKEVSNYEDALLALKDFTYPLVIKADGLAAGKGVVICEDEKTALDSLKAMMLEKKLEDAGDKVVIEEFLKGFECSLLCFVDGETIVPMVSVKDHKQIYDNNEGPNTGGMGSVSPNPFLHGMDDILNEEVLKPFLKGLKEDNIDYRGVIFIGLMIDENKPKALEFNVRFGDPETQSVIMRLDSDLLDIMEAVSEKRLKEADIRWKDETAMCLLLTAQGYPGKYQKGDIIEGLDKLDDDIVVFHAGTALKDGKLLTNGGRVLNLCALGKDLETCRQKLYANAEKVNFVGKYYRKDIGLH